MVLETEDLSQKADKVSGPQNTMKMGVMVRKRLFTGQAIVRGWDGVAFGEKGVGRQIVELCLRSSALCLLVMI